MNSNNVVYNANLIQLGKKLNKLGINTINHSKNDIEIFFDDTQKDIILNTLSQVDTHKNGFIFKTIKKGDQRIKSVLITFYRNMDLSCDFLNGCLDNKYDLFNLNNFNKIDLILDTFPYDNIEFSIKKNFDIRDKYLITFKLVMTEEQLNKNENFISDNDEFSSRLVHTICTKNQDGNYDVTYGLLYENEEDLDNLLTIKNENTYSKKLVKQLI